MRNHLAEEALDDDMYNLMSKYKESLKDGKHLESTIELLDNTRQVVNVFRDSRPICDLNDLLVSCRDMQSAFRCIKGYYCIKSSAVHC